MNDIRPARTASSGADLPERSRLGHVFGPSLLIALSVVLLVLLTVGRVVPIGPVGALVILALAWFAAFAAMLRWRAPASRNGGRRA